MTARAKLSSLPLGGKGLVDVYAKMIRRLVTRSLSGQTTLTYEQGRAWPVAAAERRPDGDPEQLTVGVIFLRPSIEDDVEQLGDEWAEQLPVHFEVWCVRNDMFLSWFASKASDILGGRVRVDQQKLFEQLRPMVITCRKVFPHVVELWDEEMPGPLAFDLIEDRLNELEDEDGVEPPGDGVPADGPPDGSQPIEIVAQPRAAGEQPAS